MNADQQQKLHPIYVALDAHQYSRAIKLGSALPDTNVLGKALLAHAYSKNGQRHNALLTLQTILISNRIPSHLREEAPSSSGATPSKATTLFFWELQHEVESSLTSGQQRHQEQHSNQQPSQQQAQQSTSSKKSKKGKKKPVSSKAGTSSSQQQQQQQSSAAANKWDWIDQLDTPPTLPENWEVQPPLELAITDETTLATISVTLQTLKLPLTAYQLYSWASAANPTNETLLTKTFTSGLSVLASPSKWTHHSHIEMSTVVLGHLQAVALQWARLAVSSSSKNSSSLSPLNSNDDGDEDGRAGNFAFMLTTAWAAQTALWQLEWLPKDDKRWLILPRLAESMARRLISGNNDNNKSDASGDDGDASNVTTPSSADTSSIAAEVQLLCLRALEVQSKWSDMNDLLEVTEKKQQELMAMTAAKVGLSDQGDDDDDDPEEIITSTMSEFGVAMTKHQILMKRANALERMERYELARDIYEILLSTTCPDDWNCWLGYWNCMRRNNDSASQATQELIENVLSGRRHKRPNENGGADDDQADHTDLAISTSTKRKYPLRGPSLMKVEVAATAIRELTHQQQENGEDKPIAKEMIQTLIAAIEVYAEEFAPRAPCAFTDLSGYIELLLNASKLNRGIDNEDARDRIEAMLDWATRMLQGSAASPALSSTSPGDSAVANTTKERREKLRTHIFAARVLHKILSVYTELQDRFLPNLESLITEWQTSLSINSSNEGEETQKENRPGDDLLLLAVQQLLYCDRNSQDALVTAAVLLETAIHHSPHNAYLKMTAIDVYYQLNAMSRSWEFFQVIGLKHIQLDSCTYTVLPYLITGGLYNEAIDVGNALLRFQAGTARDCGEYAGRAMEAGTLSKANEFLIFQRERMNKSLTLLQAKGIILDSAPLFAKAVPRKKHDEDPILQGGLGMHQGIVGGDEDLGRATRMVVEAHNPYAALSLVSWADDTGRDEIDSASAGPANGENMAIVVDVDQWTDNRDFTIFSHEILYQTKRETKYEMVHDALRRGHLHGLLIRASLCMDAAKGPKKGKIVKNSDEVERRTSSLLKSVDVVTKFVELSPLPDTCHGGAVGCKTLILAMLDLCKILALISTGLPNQSETDSLEQRELRATEYLQSVATPRLQKGHEELNVTTVQQVCSILPNYIVPTFALFRMCSNVCTLFGWGQRKRYTKRCAGALADWSIEFTTIVKALLAPVERLPPSETNAMAANDSSVSSSTIQNEVYSSLLDENMVRDTSAMIIQAQFRTRTRVEPVLQEMIEFLEGFDVPAEGN